MFLFAEFHTVQMTSLLNAGSAPLYENFLRIAFEEEMSISDKWPKE